MATFNRQLKKLVLNRLPLPFNISVNEDMKDTEHHRVYIQGPGVILPDASYYKPEMAETKQALIGMWTNMAKLVLAKTPLSAEDQDKYIADTLAFDELLGGLVKTSEEWSEYVKRYNPTKTGRVCNLVKPVALRKLLKSLFGFVPETVVVTEPRFFNNFKTVFNEETFELYKHWAYVTGLLDSCSYLSEELREMGGMFMRAISGIPAMTPINKFAYQIASRMYSEPVGIYYGEKYFGEEAKKDVTEIVYEIIGNFVLCFVIRTNNDRSSFSTCS
jgi:putative endopeptidase